MDLVLELTRVPPLGTGWRYMLRFLYFRELSVVLVGLARPSVSQYGITLGMMNGLYSRRCDV